MRRTCLLLISFYFFILIPMFGQDTQAYADSVLSVIKNTSGQERTEVVADFSRNANFQKVDHTPFKGYLEEGFNWETEHPDPDLLVTLRLGLVNMLVAESDLPGSVEQLQEILHSGTPLSAKDSISTYNFLYAIYYIVGAHTEAWEVLGIRDRVLLNNPSNDPFFVEFNQGRLTDQANLYYITGQYESALAPYRGFIRQMEAKQDLHWSSGGHNNLGLAFLKLEQPDSALFHFSRALDYWRLKLNEQAEISVGDSAYWYLVEGNMGSAYSLQGKYEEALPLLWHDLQYNEKLESPPGQISCLHELANTYLALDQPKQAQDFLETSYDLLKNYPESVQIERNLELRIEASEALGDINQAYDLHKKWVAFQDSLEEETNASRMEIMQVAYEVDKKNEEISRQKLDLAKADAESERRQKFNLAMGGGVILLLLFVGFLVIQTVQRRKRAEDLAEINQQIESQKQIIEESLQEKEILLKEVYHRVKNNLQLISGILELQSIKIQDEAIREILEESQSRVRTIALIHQQLYQSKNLGKIDFHDYLTKLVNGIAMLFNLPGRQVVHEIQVNDLSFDLNVAVPLGLIVNELVTNAYNHGFSDRESGKIFIGIQPIGENRFEMIVSDNGKGLPPDFDPSTSDSLGLRLVKGLSRQMDGNYRIENEQGTQFIIQFQT